MILRVTGGIFAIVGVITMLRFGIVLGEDANVADSEGQALYVAQQCWQCHGFEGQGGAAVRIAPTLYPFEVFAQRVRHTNLMPAYSPNVLSDEQLEKIYEFVRSVPEPPAVDEIPELSSQQTGSHRLGSTTVVQYRVQ
ncbi:MAG: cytochrome c [Gammaproteobacteria bacterium]